MDRPTNLWAAGAGADRADLRLFERLPDPYLVLDASGAVVCANAAWRATFDGAANPQATRAALAEQRRHCRHLIATLVSQLRAGQRRASPVFRLDGGTATDDPGAPLPRYWQIHASLVAPADDLAGLVALRFDDVTARTLAEQGERREKAQMRSYARVRRSVARGTPPRLGEHLGQFEQALAVTGVGAWVIDLSSGTAICSEQCLRDLGATCAGDLSREAFLGGEPDHFAVNWRSILAGRPFEFEQKVRTGTGHRWVLLRGMGRASEDGTVRAVMGVTLDITKRKHREIQLDVVAGAERSGRERSEALARTMDHFVTAVSHELRSPLNAIVSWAELLQFVADPAHVARAGEAIRRNGRQLSRMVDDLLDSGAVVTGKLSVNLKPFDLGPMVAIVVEDMRKSAEHKDLALRMTEIGSCLVLADENRLGQVVSNLVTNAIKFTDAGAINVWMDVSDENVEISVRDTGRGIEPDALPRIFERFRQIAPQTSGRVGGLGLGLWLARQIVDLHGGTISVVSEGAGRGSTFAVRLPRTSGRGG
jgi:signal transduction histidine kinase